MATYEDESTGSVTPASCSPSVWGEAGTETITFSFEGTDVTCEVVGEAISPVITVVSITVSGSEGAAQPNDEQPDFTGYTFTFGLDNGQSIVKTGAEITANNAAGPTYFINYGGTAFHNGDHPLWDWSNPQETVNIELGDYWEAEGYEIADPAPTTSILMGTHYATSLTYTGSLTNPQYILDVNHTLGEPDLAAKPDLTGLSFTVGFADGTSEAVSTSDCQVSPSEYEAGNPSNLTSQPLTITYAGSEVGTPSVAITNNITHRPDGQTLDSANAGYVYHDFPAELWNLIKTEGSTFTGMAAVYQSQVDEGNWLCLWLTDDAYQNDTAVDYTTFGQWVGRYGIVPQSSGTINTPGFIPGWGSRFDANDLSACYISEYVDGSSSISAFETCHVLVGKATKNISGSVKKSDLDYTNGVHYTIHVGPVDYS